MTQPKPSLLFVSNEFHFPTGTGAHVRISNLIKQYARSYAITLIAHRAHIKDAQKARAFFSEFLDDVHLLSNLQLQQPARRLDLRSLTEPRSVLDFNAAPFKNAVRTIVGQRGPFDVIHVDRWYGIEAIRHDLESRFLASKYVLDLDASEYRRRQQQSNSYRGGLLGRLKVAAEPHRVRAYENRFLSHFDAVLVSSEKEMEQLRARTRLENLVLVRNGYDVPDSPRLVDGSSRSAARAPSGPVMLFVGTLKYEPNVRGFEYFADQVLPRVRSEIPEAEFLHMGTCPEEFRQRYAGRDGIRFSGFVDDVTEVYDTARVVVVPIFEGAGTRIKVLEAAAFGKPIVSTAFGAEDLDLIHDESILLAGDQAGLARGCVELLQDDEKCARLGNSARDVIRSQYSWSRIGTALDEGLAQLLGADLRARCVITPISVVDDGEDEAALRKAS